MLDWKNVRFEDFTFEVDVEGIQDVGTTLVFPVRVRYQDGSLVFVHGVSMRSDFFRQLKEIDEWEPALMRILKSRVREEILRRKRQNTIPIADRMQLIGKDPQTLV